MLGRKRRLDLGECGTDPIGDGLEMYEIEAVHLGCPNLMWGADVPHSEGTSPYTLEAIRTVMWNLPEDDLHALLSTRAADVYGFDLGHLQSVADRIGPTLEQIQTPLPSEQRPRYPQDTRCTVFRNLDSLLETPEGSSR